MKKTQTGYFFLVGIFFLPHLGCQPDDDAEDDDSSSTTSPTPESGTNPVISTSPTHINFGEVAVDVSSVVSVEISNEGSAALAVSSISVEPAINFTISLVEVASLPVELAEGEGFEIEVEFRPLEVGEISALLQIVSNDQDQPTVTIQLDGVGIPSFDADSDGDGYDSDEAGSDDCDDANEDINPGATETCDGLDNDCDDSIDEDGETSFYRDEDGDGAGNAHDSYTGCGAEAGYVTNGDDCDDSNAAAYPGAPEQCDERDNDCDLEVDEGVLSTYYADNDDDGWGNAEAPSYGCSAEDDQSAQPGDCNDENSSVNPSASEICDSLDNDCDTAIDEDAPRTYYADDDEDNYGNPSVYVTDCKPPDGYVEEAGDCDDSDSEINPEADDTCDGVDTDCNGEIDDAPEHLYYLDSDGDGYGAEATTIHACTVPTGYAEVSGDCNDNISSTHPEASELCDSVDNDCDGTVDENVGTYTFYRDQDGDTYGTGAETVQGCVPPDGYSVYDSDCDDSNSAVNPNADEVCNSIDDDCDGRLMGCWDGTDWENCDWVD